jgi:hypothetical protein
VTDARTKQKLRTISDAYAVLTLIGGLSAGISLPIPGKKVFPWRQYNIYYQEKIFKSDFPGFWTQNWFMLEGCLMPLLGLWNSLTASRLPVGFP